MSTPHFPTPPQRPDSNPVPEEAQRVFDTVTGPNLRVSDNLIQLAVIVGGMFLGAAIGAGYNFATGNQPALGALLGGFAGVVLSLLLSGAIIGLVRFILAFKRR